MAFSVADISQAKAFRISPADTNYFVMLFDKNSRRGGRETNDAASRFVKDSDWSDFAQRQIELLVTAGIPRKQAESYYAQGAK